MSSESRSELEAHATTMSEFIIVCREDRRYRVEYIVRAKNLAAAQAMADSGSFKPIGEESDMLCTIAQDVMSVEPNE